MSSGTNDTIAAISTPPGEGGVGIVRLSGPDAVRIAAQVFASSRGADLSTAKRQRVFHGHVVDEAGLPIDEVLVHRMRAPHSYTAEDVIEINTHGGAAPLRAVLDTVLRRGARLARPGEFTRRAFENGRIDLAQAEAVIDLVRARSDAALRAANAVAGGALSREMYTLRDTLANALARVEAAVDFPEDDLPELVDDALFEGLQDARARMARLLDSARAGRLYRDGAAVAIVGRPNVGKSSLFNALLRDTRAIVSPMPGTTRDRIEEDASIGGMPLRLVDTAGMRATEDAVEQAGVDLARAALREADAVLFVVDASSPVCDEDRVIAEELLTASVPVIVARNKADLACPLPHPEPEGFSEGCLVSAVTGAGLEALEAALARALLGAALGADTPMISRLHQADSLRRAKQCLERALDCRSVSPELLAFELREALAALGEITGETTPEDLLDIIFGQFCIGK